MENVLMIASAALCGCAGFTALCMKNQKAALALRRWLWISAATLTLTAVICMLYYLLTDRFEYDYVAQHSAKAQAVLYKISALWAGQEGSFLLWSAVLSLTGLPLLRADDRLSAKVFGAYALISMCLFVMTAVSNPFVRLYMAPADGAGVTQALKNPWMVVHPPLVFVSYSGMAVLAAHAAGFPEQSDMLFRKTQYWSRFSWVMLGLGIFTGSIWAYNALGWGGYWAWDPIENAALVPWLILCGYLHTRGKCSRARCILPFALACFGTFLTRSGILGDTSMHAYTEGGTAASVIIIAMLLGVAGWLTYIKLRRRNKGSSPAPSSACLRSLWAENQRVFAVLTYIFATLILTGTVAPIVTGYSTPMAVYTVFAVAFALVYSVLLLLRDKQTLMHHSFFTMGLSTAIVVGIAFALNATGLYILLLLWVCLMPPCLWIISGFKIQGWRYYVNHIGMVLLIIGVICSLGLAQQGIVIIEPNSNGALINGILVPVARVLNEDVTILTSASTDVIAQGGSAMVLPGDAVAVPFITRPLINLFWIGGFLMILSPLVTIAVRSCLSRAMRPVNLCDLKRQKPVKQYRAKMNSDPGDGLNPKNGH